MLSLWRKPIFAIWLATAAWGSWELRHGGCGVTWDEPTYTIAAAAYAGFFGHSETAEPWRLNHEHPPLAKYAIACGQMLWLIATGEPDFLLMGGRLASLVFFALMLTAVWLLLAPLDSQAAAMAVLLCAACPRLVGEAQLATLDMPLACFWLWALLAYERATQPASSARWRAAACLLYACAFLTKFSAIALAPALLAWRLILYALTRRKMAIAGENSQRFPWNDIALWCIMQACALLMLVAIWPWLWKDTIDRLLNYLRFSLHHNMAPVMYFGKAYGANWQWDSPPWHYAPVMLLITTPIFVTFGAILSCGWLLDATRHSAAPNSSRPAGLRIISLCLLGCAMLPLATMMPKSVVYDGVRLFLPAIPLICCLAGWGWRWLTLRAASYKPIWLRRPIACAPSAIALVLVVFCRAAVTCDLGYYNLLIGGPAGAEKMGMEVCYWCVLLPRAKHPSGGWQALCEQARPHSAPPYRIRLVGVGEKHHGDFLRLIGDIPDNERFAVVTDESWNVAVVVNRCSLRETSDFLAAFPPTAGRGEYLVTCLPTRIWPLKGAAGVYIFGRR